MNLLYKRSGEAVSYSYFLGSFRVPFYEFLKAPGGWGPQIHNPITMQVQKRKYPLLKVELFQKYRSYIDEIWNICVS